jgi:hypothetical protein
MQEISYSDVAPSNHASALPVNKSLGPDNG